MVLFFYICYNITVGLGVGIMNIATIKQIYRILKTSDICLI